MQHTELQAPVALSEWQAFIRAADPQVTFQEYRALFEGPERFTITDELNQIVEDFGAASRDAVYGVLGEEIYAVWIGPFHNYLAVVCSMANGDTEDAALIVCYSKPDPDLPRRSSSSAASGEPRPVSDDGGAPPEESAWETTPMPDLSDMDRMHEAAAGGQLADILTRIARRAPR